MKNRPILFIAPMVRAILDGTKSQTRRAAKPVKHPDLGNLYEPSVLAREPQHVIDRACPYGQPGDRLWVRETWAETDEENGSPVVSYKAGGCIAIGRTAPSKKDYLIHSYAWAKTPEPDRWRPSIHMPRWASRITLEITGVRVERLQDISGTDCLAEGIALHQDHHGKPRNSLYGPYQTYRDLWESINGPGSWDLKPWVWVVEFKRVNDV